MSTSTAANPRVPAPVNEPARDFTPGSPESRSVTAKIAELRSRVTEIPHVIDGERRFTGDRHRRRGASRSRQRPRPPAGGGRRRHQGGDPGLAGRTARVVADALVGARGDLPARW